MTVSQTEPIVEDVVTRPHRWPSVAGRRCASWRSRRSASAFFYVLVLRLLLDRGRPLPHYSNFTAILAAVAVLGIVSIGQALAIIAGGFDLSVSGTLPLGAVAFASFVNHGMNWPLATVIVILIGAAVGLVNGFIVARLGINPLITTLGTLSIAGGLAFTITNGVTGPFNDPSGRASGATPRSTASSGASSRSSSSPSPAWSSLRYTVFGRSLYALGGNRRGEPAGRHAGRRCHRLALRDQRRAGGIRGRGHAGQLLAGSATVESAATCSRSPR